MLSRRNVRIKVMQMLYSMSRDPRFTYESAIALYRKKVEESFQLYLLNVHYLVRFAGYALTDAEKRTAKLLPTETDRKFSAKLYHNPLIQSLVKHNIFQDCLRTYKLDASIDEDIVRTIYTSFAKDERYDAFLQKEENTLDETITLLLALYKEASSSELFDETMEDFSMQWFDDKSLVVGSLKQTIKALPAADDFYLPYKPNAETVKAFGEELFAQLHKSDTELLGIIEPSLKNWDADRVAVIDMILLKMAVCELIHFPTIPAKVTLNEFVEISKMYSTDKSKDFINGILDRLMKKLQSDGRVQKKGRGLNE